MPHNRYFLNAFFDENATLSLSGSEHHHLACVLRSRTKDLVELVNGRGQLALAEIIELKKNEAVLTVQRILEQRPSPPQLILAQAIPHMNHLEWIIEKGTELNVSAFWLFPGMLSEKTTLNDSQQLRLKNLTVSSMKQCGRLDLPGIVLQPALAQWHPMKGTLLFGDTTSGAPYLWDLPLAKPLDLPLVLFIGPEKGFDFKERNFLLTTLKAKGIRLHPHILRTETASLAALAQLQQFLQLA
jgi:16S rRNA (uracil1498-N3)-methyltransferase